MRRVGILFFMITFLMPSVGQTEGIKHNNTEPWYYWDKGNKEENLLLSEYHILMNQLENALSDFQIE